MMQGCHTPPPPPHPMVSPPPPLWGGPVVPFPAPPLWFLCCGGLCTPRS